VKRYFRRFVNTGMVLAFVAVPVTAGAAGEDGAQANVMSLVGTLRHVTPESRTVVVEVPLEEQSLTVGAWAIPTTTITADGTPVDLQSLDAGSKVRIKIRRVPNGDELLSLEVLKAPAG
jgi:hypothetical protein